MPLFNVGPVLTWPKRQSHGAAGYRTSASQPAHCAMTTCVFKQKEGRIKGNLACDMVGRVGVEPTANGL